MHASNRAVVRIRPPLWCQFVRENQGPRHARYASSKKHAMPQIGNDERKDVGSSNSTKLKTYLVGEAESSTRECGLGVDGDSENDDERDGIALVRKEDVEACLTRDDGVFLRRRAVAGLK